MFSKKPPVDHAAILKSAVERFVAINHRWPQSMDELDPYGIRGFVTDSVAGFEQSTESELSLRYVHPRGKAMVHISRPPQNAG